MIKIKKSIEEFLAQNQMDLSLLANGVVFITTPRKDSGLLRHIAVLISVLLESNKDLIVTTNFTKFLDDGSCTILTFASKKDFLK